MLYSQKYYTSGNRHRCKYFYVIDYNILDNNILLPLRNFKGNYIKFHLYIEKLNLAKLPFSFGSRYNIS